MLTIDIFVIFTPLFILALSLVFVGHRIRANRRPVLLHLAVYLGLAFLSYLAPAMTALNLASPIGKSSTFSQNLILFAAILSFGPLTLSFLKVKQRFLTRYAGGVLLLLGLWSLFSLGILGSEEDSQQIAQVIAAVGWVSTMATVFIALATALKKQHSARHSNRLRYWLVAATLLGSGSSIIFFNPAFANLAGTPLFVAGSVLSGYILLSYHTPDLNRLVGSGLRYVGITAVTATLFYLGLAATIIVSRGTATSRNVFLWSVFLAILLAVVAPPLWMGLRRFFTRLIFGKKQADEKEIVQHYSRSLSSALDMQRLGEILLKLMVETLDAGRGAVFVNERGNPEQISLRVLAGEEIGDSSQLQFKSTSLFINYFRQGHKFLHQYDIDERPEFSDMDADERAWLAALKMELYIPIRRYQSFMGLLAFGSRTDGGTYQKGDISLMVALAEQAVLAMDSARLFEQLASINQEVGSLNKKIAGLDQNKSDFLSIASHELRTPLTHIHGYSKMLLDLTEEETRDIAYVKTIVEGIAKGSDRMKNILDMMFDVTEADEGELALMMGPVSLKEVIAQASGPFLMAMDQRRIAFKKQGIEDLPAIQADNGRLVQAFENLMSNAIKYTPDGGLITIEGKTMTLDDQGSCVEIIFRDTGIGLAPEYHETVFEKFFRVDDVDHHSTSKTKFRGGGPGLGLTLVRSIAQAHGGRVWVESEGCDEQTTPGSSFHFLIPLHPVTPLLPQETRRQSQIETVHWSSNKLVPSPE